MAYPPCWGDNAPVMVSVTVLIFKGVSTLVITSEDTLLASKFPVMKLVMAVEVAVDGASCRWVEYMLIVPLDTKSGGITKYSVISFLSKACVAAAEVSKGTKMIFPWVVN